MKFQSKRLTHSDSQAFHVIRTTNVHENVDTLAEPNRNEVDVACCRMPTAEVAG